MRKKLLVNTLNVIKMSSNGFYGSDDVVLGQKYINNLKKMRETISASPTTKLMVVSDFDHTLTKFTSLQCHDVVGMHKGFTEEFIQEFRDSFKVPFDSLSEWWRFTHDLIVDKSGLTRAMLQERMDEGIVHPRSGFGELTVSLRECNVPFVIVSAGFKDVIHHTLNVCNVPTDTDHLFHIDANYLEFKECGRLSNILPVDPIHSCCKHAVVERAPHMFAFIQEGRLFESDITTEEKTISAQLNATASVADCVHAVLGDSDTPVLAPSTNSLSQTAAAASPPVEPSPVVAIVMGDRAPDFDVLAAFPEIIQFRIGFARSFDPEHVDPLLLQGNCDVVLVGQEHGLEAVQLLIDDLLQLRDGNKTLSVDCNIETEAI